MHFLAISSSFGGHFNFFFFLIFQNQSVGEM